MGWLNAAVWLTLKATLLGVIYVAFNALAMACNAFILPLMADILDVPNLDTGFGLALTWLKLANTWVPLSEAIAMWSALYGWSIAWVPIKKLVQYFIPTVGGG